MITFEKVDWLIIGGGSGGLSIAEAAAEKNLNCAIIEDRHWGGTCVNIGCVPKKLFWQTAKAYGGINHNEGLGIKTGERLFSWERFYKSRSKEIQKIEKWYLDSLNKKNIKTYKGRGVFINENTVSVNNKTIEADKIFISTGSTPVVPDVEGADIGWVSDDVFFEKKQPKSITVVGSGYIALEFACVLQTLGTQVSLVVRKNRVLGSLDEALQIKAEENLKSLGVKLFKNNQVSRVTRTKKGVEVKLNNHNELLETDRLLWAIGRKPNISNLGLEKTGVDFSGEKINVNAFSETNKKNIFALGDVAGRPQLTPVAIQEARRLSRRLIDNQQQEKIDLSIIPTVVFTLPPIATAGMTQKTSEEQFGKENIVCYVNEFGSLLNNMVGKLNETVFMKMVCERDSQKVLGIHMVGEGVEEILQGFAVAMRMGATKHDFDRTIAIHPTVAEELVTMKPML